MEDFLQQWWPHGGGKGSKDIQMTWKPTTKIYWSQLVKPIKCDSTSWCNSLFLIEFKHFIWHPCWDIPPFNHFPSPSTYDLYDDWNLLHDRWQWHAIWVGRSTPSQVVRNPEEKPTVEERGWTYECYQRQSSIFFIFVLIFCPQSITTATVKGNSNSNSNIT